MTTFWEKAVHSANCTCLSWALIKFCVCPSFPFGIEGGMWDVIVFIPDHYLSIYFVSVPHKRTSISIQSR